MEEVAKLEVKAHENTLKVTDLEDRIGGLQQELANKIAQNKIDIQLAYDSDVKSFVEKYLRENNMTTIEVVVLSDLKSELNKVKDNFDSNLKAEVAKAVAIEKSNSANALKMMELEQKHTEAANKAQIEQLNAKVEFLEEQVDSWKEALAAERTASVERAKASSIGTLNVGNPNQR